MTEEEARDATRAIVGDTAFGLLEAFAEQVRTENERQNLVAKASLETMWLRHFLDSAQLLPLAKTHAGLWIDVGTGAGFPGVVIALASDRPVTLVEPRRKRAQFLQHVVDGAGIAGRVTVAQLKADRLQSEVAAVISARAVSSVMELLVGTVHLAGSDTVYLLPKGQSATTEVDDARTRFEGMFHVEQSMTDPNSGIIVASKLRKRR